MESFDGFFTTRHYHRENSRHVSENNHATFSEHWALTLPIFYFEKDTVLSSTSIFLSLGRQRLKKKRHCVIYLIPLLKKVKLVVAIRFETVDGFYDFYSTNVSKKERIFICKPISIWEICIIYDACYLIIAYTNIRSEKTLLYDDSCDEIVKRFKLRNYTDIIDFFFIEALKTSSYLYWRSTRLNIKH